MAKCIDCTVRSSERGLVGRSSVRQMPNTGAAIALQLISDSTASEAATKEGAIFMGKQNEKAHQAGAGSIRSSEDYAIYPHRDNVSAGATPFKLDDYGDKGALDEGQIVALSDRHRLSMEQARELSLLLGYSLDIDTRLSFFTISRATVERRLHDRKLAKRNRDTELSAVEANALFDSFGFRVVVVEEADASKAAVNHQEAAKTRTDSVTYVSLDEARRILQPDDRRKEQDNRRLHVVESCCYVAQDAGWPLTYTTDSSLTKNQRGGRLIELVKDVIEMVSEGGRVASVHTLKSDIELVRRRFEMRGDLSSKSHKK
ncbi:hypothetical protein [Thioclava electrotropha]|uniref:Uncharacterized protein n=1 Tax=Thioclava electrotropha TaxID=1549850 RepID=A0ABX6YPH1_9RHOB|nr:hypothetical protein [Thioclava electrotropha]QPZ89697.1 hypothetical protein AKL02_001550 [Thioclava electrotropha]